MYCLGAKNLPEALNLCQTPNLVATDLMYNNIIPFRINISVVFLFTFMAGWA